MVQFTQINNPAFDMVERFNKQSNNEKSYENKKPGPEDSVTGNNTFSIPYDRAIDKSKKSSEGGTPEYLVYIQNYAVWYDVATAKPYTGADVSEAKYLAYSALLVLEQSELNSPHARSTMIWEKEQKLTSQDGAFKDLKQEIGFIVSAKTFDADSDGDTDIGIMLQDNSLIVFLAEDTTDPRVKTDFERTTSHDFEIRVVD